MSAIPSPFCTGGPYPKLRPMQPRPMADTSSPLFPSLRFCMLMLLFECRGQLLSNRQCQTVLSVPQFQGMPGNRAESKDECDQRRARRQRIREQRNGDIAAAQALAHNAGPTTAAVARFRAAPRSDGAPASCAAAWSTAARGFFRAHEGAHEPILYQWRDRI